MICKICSENTEKIFNAVVINKYNISYFQCNNCRFIQTETPYWLEEAYKNAINLLDVGLLSRNYHLSKTVEPVLKYFYDYKGKFLDYGGGYGIFVRLMRDAGFNFYRQDLYCENIFARYFDIKDLPDNTKFELVTAFEVFEHWTNPVEELTKLFNYSDSVLFSTELQPDKYISSVNDWWYFVPEAGQHISFYTKKSLEILAKKFNRKLYSNNLDLHLITSQSLSNSLFNITQKNDLLNRVINKISNSINLPFRRNPAHLESLLQKDFNLYKKILNKSVD